VQIAVPIVSGGPALFPVTVASAPLLILSPFRHPRA